MNGDLPFLDEGESEAPAYVPRLLLGKPSGDGWFRVGDLGDPDSDQLNTVLSSMATERGYTDPRSVGAGFPLIASLAVGGLIWRAAHDLPIPALTADHAWWHILPAANVTAIAVSERPDYLPPSQIGRVLHALWDGVMESIRRRTGFPVRAQWSLLASAMAPWLTDWMENDHPQAIAHVEAIYERDSMLKIGRPRVTWLDIQGTAKAFTTRKVCCFNYLGAGGGHCTSQCPIVPADERLDYARQHFSGN